MEGGVFTRVYQVRQPVEHQVRTLGLMLYSSSIYLFEIDLFLVAFFRSGPVENRNITRAKTMALHMILFLPPCVNRNHC